MFALLNRYSNTYVLVAVVDSFQRAGLFESFRQYPSRSLEQLQAAHHANPGYLAIALHCLASAGWLQLDQGGGYALTDLAEPDAISPDIRALYAQPIDTLLTDAAAQTLLIAHLQALMSSHAIPESDALLADWLRHGPVALPVLMALHHMASTDSVTRLLSQGSLLNDTLRTCLCDYLVQQAWIRPSKEGRRTVLLTDMGEQHFAHTQVMGIAASYRPMLAQMDALLFGDAGSVFMRSPDGHVDRLLNVRASSYQNERYFADAEWQILALFNTHDFASQPRYIAAMGCGDGSILKQLYDTIHLRSLRGRELDAFPLTLIGIDTNQTALDDTAHTLANLPHVLLHGDVNDPAQMQSDLRAMGIDPSAVLHIRAFLDHNFHACDENGVADDVDDDGAAFPLTPGSVYVDASGQPLAPQRLVSQWRAHLQCWSDVLNDHGLMVAEVHCLNAALTREYPHSENLYFDHLHAFSGQYLIEAELFLILAANVGLFAASQPLRTPKTLPFCRITLSHFHRRAYQIRHARTTDHAALIELEQRCWPDALRAADDLLLERVATYPQGQFVLELEGRVVGVIYSQRIDSMACMQSQTSDSAFSQHRPDGTLVQLLAVNILPELHERNLSDELLEFMLQRCSVMSGISSVVAITLCKHFHRQNAHDLVSYIRQVDAQGHAVDPVLRFHEQHGARILDLAANYRPRDSKNQGHGVWVQYDLFRRRRVELRVEVPLIKKAVTAANVIPVHGQSTTHAVEAIAQGIDQFLEYLIKACLPDVGVTGASPVRRYDKERPLMEIGLDSVDLLLLAEKIQIRYRIRIAPNFFIQNNTPARITARLLSLINAESSVVRIKAVEKLPPEDESNTENDIAIIGIPCRLPSHIKTPQQLVNFLRDERTLNNVLLDGRQQWSDGSIVELVKVDMTQAQTDENVEANAGNELLALIMKYCSAMKEDSSVVGVTFCKDFNRKNSLKKWQSR